MNSWGNLKWDLEEPSQHTHFLDLNITLKENSLDLSTFQKPLNLYLYLPPLSAHPHSCLKGLIKGELNCYWWRNSVTNFQHLITKLVKWFNARGHSVSSLEPIFRQAAATLDNNRVNSNQNTDQDTTLYIHWTHHPSGIQRSDLRRIYNKTLEPHDINNKMIVAISWPKNLRDILTRFTLALPEGSSIQHYITQLTTT
jgi:hypothetical protein